MLSLLRAFWASFDHAATPGARGLRLLRENLTASQREQYDRRRHFDVIGGQTGRRYRVYDMNSINVDELDSAGRCVRKLCFQPEGLLVPGDVLLAQKLALELYELEALRIANAYPSHHSRFSYGRR
jgi:hypothetical protein